MPQYFASFEPFEIFDEFNGVPGTYIKSFLISDIVNLNKWQATHEANLSNLDSFLGRPGIHYINSEGKRDHTGATSFEKSLQLQELYRAASIIAVGSDIPTKKNWQVSKMVDDSITEKIKSGEIKWISPSIWPDENAVEIIDHTDGTKIDRVHGYRALHYAFIDEPAYGVDAEIKSFCDGTTQQCQIELQKFDASIDTVGPITDKKIIILPPDKKKQNNSSKQPVNTSHKKIITSKTQMATSEEELRKELEEAKKALKATEEELQKEKDETAKKSKKALEDEEEEKDKEARKAETEDDDEEKKALKAQVEALTAQAKIPIIDKIVSAQLSASVISPDSESKARKSLSAASIDALTQQYELIKPFETKLNSFSASINVPYYGSEGSSFDASLDDVDDEALLMEVSGQQ